MLRLTGGILLLVACAAPAAHGQERPTTTYDEWRLLEPTDEMLAYRNQLREGVFDEAAKSFLAKTALQQLGLPKNRPTIDRVRRRMRDVLCGDQGVDPKVAAAAMQVVSDFMIAAARDTKADIVLRTNAALLVGELRGPGNKPWPQAAAPLAALLGDDALPPAVRIAAAAGLARHVEAEPEARSADVGPVLVALVRSPLADVDPVAADWLRSRALVMLARMGSAAPAETVAAAAGMLGDASQSVDLRVRAAAALGACIKAPSDTDVAAALATIRDLASVALEATQAGIARQDLAERLSAGGPVAPRPGVRADARALGSAVGTPQMFRRDAWRLATLADALAPADDDGGLVRVAGPQATTVADVAKTLRESAGLLDAEPEAASLGAAIEALALPAGASPDAAAPVNPAAPAHVDEVPETVAPINDGVPFGGG